MTPGYRLRGVLLPDESSVELHVDGTGRLQTVTAQENPRYHALLSEFGRLTGTPVLLNTSFNASEPIVCTPKEALDCFLRTKMDVLVLERANLERAPAL